MPTIKKPDLSTALKQSRLTIGKMQARQKVLLAKLEDIETDTELLLGPIGEEAQQLANAITLLREKYQPLIEQFQGWNKDVREFDDFLKG